MRQIFKHLIVGLILFIPFASYGQGNLDGTYLRTDTSVGANRLINEMTLTIRGDSIWFDKNKKKVKSDSFFSYKGTIHKYKDFYFGSLILMECDTCPTFWKYTTKSEDSVGIEVLYHSDKIDTFITNGDTSYQQEEIFSDKAGNIEVRRMSELIIKVTKTQDLFINDKLYRRKKTK